LICVLFLLLGCLSLVKGAGEDCDNCNGNVGVGVGLGVSAIVIGLLLVICVALLVYKKLRKSRDFQYARIENKN
jgi:O-antigen/teichoic acid export membrane protein